MKLRIRFFSLVLVSLLPWSVKRFILESVYGFKIHPRARIGISIVAPDYLEMGADSQIATGVVMINIRRVTIGDYSVIMRGCWFSAYPLRLQGSFSHIKNRCPDLIIGSHVGITKNHHIDCTESVAIGDFTTIAGYGSQILTHSMDLSIPRQDAKPINIGAHSFVGSRVIILPGCSLQDKTVVAAGSVITKSFERGSVLVGGVPAKVIEELPANYGYFKRDIGYVN
jgi:acetyltransferase-like isoleucine patch superfamily enzyme